MLLGLGAGCKKWEKLEGEGGADTYTRRGVRDGLGTLTGKGKGWCHRRVNGPGMPALEGSFQDGTGLCAVLLIHSIRAKLDRNEWRSHHRLSLPLVAPLLLPLLTLPSP